MPSTEAIVGGVLGVVILIAAVLVIVYVAYLGPKWTREAEEAALEKEIKEKQADLPKEGQPLQPPADTQNTNTPAPTDDGGMNAVRYGVPFRLFNTSTLGGYMAPCGTAANACGIDVTLRPATSFTPTPNLDAGDRDSVWAFEPVGSKVPGDIVQLGDAVRLRSMSGVSAETGLYLMPCGAMSDATPTTRECGADVTLGSSTDATSTWKLVGDANATGASLQFMDTVYLQTLSTKAPHYHLWLGSCGTDGVCGTDVTLLGREGGDSECQWRVEVATV